jgi:hypothetical protein
MVTHSGVDGGKIKMSFHTFNPTAFQSPDPGQPGSLAVLSPSNTGHASTLISAVDGEANSVSCIWSGFTPVFNGTPLSYQLKVDWTQDGSLTGPGSKSNQFKVEYSLNGGGAWNTLFNHTAVTSSSSGSSQVSLTLPQDITQVKVRDSLSVSSTAGTDAELTASISNIRVEVTDQDPYVIVMM